MDKLLAYIKGLRQDERDQFFARCQTTEGYVRKAASKGQEFGPELSVRIEQESAGAVTRRDLHPETWAAKWPELEAAA